MKNRLFIIAAVLSFTLCLPLSWPQTSSGIQNPGIRNPIGPGTVPPSSIRSGLVSSPNPMDTDGNLLITGNVRRGKHFRDTVPYRSTTSFSSSLGSAALSSFLRDTASSEDFGRYSNKYRTQPYYSPSQTVATLIPGRAGVFGPSNTRISTRVQQDTRSTVKSVFGLEPFAKQEALSSQGTTADDLGLQVNQTQYSPLPQSNLGRAESRSIQESSFLRDALLSQRNTERLASNEIGIRRQSEKSVVERFREQVQDIKEKTQDSVTVLAPESELLDPELQQSLPEKEASFRDSNRETSIENLISRLEKQAQAESSTGRKQTTASDYRLPSLDKSTTSTASILQEDLISQKATDWSDISRKLQTEQEKLASGTLDTLETGRGDTEERMSIGSGLSGARQEMQQRDVMEQIKQQLDGLTKSIESRLQAGSEDTQKDKSPQLPTKRETTRSGSRQYTPDLSSASSLNKLQGAEPRFDQHRLAPEMAPAEPGPAAKGKEQARSAPTARQEPLQPDWSGMGDYNNSQKTSSPFDQLNELSQAELSAKAKRIMGSHTNLESYSGAKFNQHMLTAENYLKAGRYYRAVDSFTLASIYKPNNPAALAGKGHALFAAGEYISSALFISRALAIEPEYTRTKVNLVAILGGEKKLASKIVDVEEWLAKSDSIELQFLLSYIHYRTGKLSQAKQTIDAAYEKMSQSPAIKALKTAIDYAIPKP
ncbi:MAG: tetratricopeptide repeat protein [Planctomycetota bacterium]